MSRPTVATTPAPWTFAAPWGARGFVSELAGGPVHWITFDAEDSADSESHSHSGSGSDLPPIVFVHGLGGSHLNWTLIGPALAAERRVFALDLAGFGLTSGTGRGTSVQANAELVDRFVREIAGGPAVLVGNSMGGMISVLQTAAHPDTVAGLVLVDPSLPVPRQRPDLQVATQFALYAVPGLGERVMRRAQSRLSTPALVQRVVDLCFADPGRADPRVIDAGVALADERRSLVGAEAWFLQAARSLMRVLVRPDAYRGMLARLDLPVLLIHGELDRLVPIAAARAGAARAATWETAFLPGVGHTPQLETPQLVIDAIRPWLARHPALT